MTESHRRTYGLDDLRQDYGIEPGKVRAWMRRGHVPWVPKTGKGGRLSLAPDQVTHLVVMSFLSENFTLDAAADYTARLMRTNKGKGGFRTIECGADGICALSMNVEDIQARFRSSAGMGQAS